MLIDFRWPTQKVELFIATAVITSNAAYGFVDYVVDLATCRKS
jgi:hypothetical protein